MHINELVNLFELYAPPSLAAEWDNPGLLIEPESNEISRVLVALDCTKAVALEAKAKRCELVLTHHPLFLTPVRRLSYRQPETAPACLLLRNGIGLYSSHTNLDAAKGGVNDTLAALLNLTNVRELKSADSIEPALGRIGELSLPMQLSEFAHFTNSRLCANVRVGGNMEQLVSKIAVVGGSGGDFVEVAHALGADALVTGELKHNRAIAAGFIGLCVLEAGHYETERPVLKAWIAGLQAKLKEVQCKVELLLSEEETAPLAAP